MALLTTLLIFLAKNRPKLNANLLVVFIAAEEGGEFGVGVDRMMDDGTVSVESNNPARA